jgi:hypothetical protein
MNIADLSKYYLQSVKCMELGLKEKKHNDCLFVYDDYSIMDMVQLCSKHADIMDFLPSLFIIPH